MTTCTTTSTIRSKKLTQTTLLHPMPKFKTFKFLLVNCCKLYATGLEHVIKNDYSNVRIDTLCIKPTNLKMLVLSKNYNLVIVDLDLKTDELIQALEFLRTEIADTPILVITKLMNKQLYDACKNLNVQGYLVKTTDTNLIPAVKNLLSNEEYYSPQLHKLRNEKVDSLTEREVQVLKHITLGYNNAAIAKKLFVSSETVKTHKRNIREKLGIAEVHGLINHYIKHYS